MKFQFSIRSEFQFTSRSQCHIQGVCSLLVVVRACYFWPLSNLILNNAMPDGRPSATSDRRRLFVFRYCPISLLASVLVLYSLSIGSRSVPHQRARARWSNSSGKGQVPLPQLNMAFSQPVVPNVQEAVEKIQQKVSGTTLDESKPETWGSVTLVFDYTVTEHTGKRDADVFYSFAGTSFPEYNVVYKVVTPETLARGPTSLRAARLPTSARNTYFTSSSVLEKDLGPGEDPRVFRFQNKTYCLTWTYHGSDWKHFLVDVMTGERKSLDTCVSGFRGKNWVPLPYKNTLFVAYRVHPQLQVFTYDVITSSCSTEIVQNDTKITEYRGGSNGVEIGPKMMMTVGHRTLNARTHVPYLMLISMEDMRTRLLRVSIRENGSESVINSHASIFDPTSLWRDSNGTFHLGATITPDGPWRNLYHRNCTKCSFNMRVYKLEPST